MLNDKNKKLLSLFSENKVLILKSLYECRENTCGCDLVATLGIPKNLVSYHLKQLREIGVVEETRCGKTKSYKIVDDEIERVGAILKIVELV
ncbi:MAG: Bacterial regulatory protein, arsR family [bacterium ADurb.Bin400]|nr:MAG: Bacterial regulatory protein, arsR family [bacterium ADurb.Bin400]